MQVLGYFPGAMKCKDEFFHQVAGNAFTVPVFVTFALAVVGSLRCEEVAALPALQRRQCATARRRR